MNSSLKEYVKAHPEIWRGLDVHFTVYDLCAYHEGRLTEAEESQIRNHILVCEDCEESLRDLTRFLADNPEPGRFWSAELASAWLALQKALRDQQAAGTP
ncbi:MAG TPA: zf-HC2 domain-containing protein [Thermoanaerobaculia bacterium]|nr:zf-HC2 domain-containing protein [Thermoanaerobaculia bacterium]